MQLQAQTRKHIDQESLIAGWVAQARQDGEEDTYAGRRRWPRATWRVPVTLETPLDGRRRRTVRAVTRDVSLGGIGITVRNRIGAMTVVRLFVAACTTPVYGRVMHCSDTVGAFILGIEFLPEGAVEPAARKSA